MSVIALAPNPWAGQWVNRQHLLSRLGRNHKVLYSTGAWSVWDRKLPEWRAADFLGALRASDSVQVECAPKFLLRWPRVPAIDRSALYLHAKWLRSRLRSASGNPLVALVFHPSFFPYLRFLEPDFIAYHAYDMFDATPGWNRSLERYEIELLRQADLVTTVTETIAERLAGRVAREIRLLPNGVDLSLFDRVQAEGSVVPPDLASIPSPRLGYVGSLHPQIDFGLVADIAGQRPGWNFVFVGGAPSIRDERAAAELSRCRSLANVHFLGEKSRFEVPRYLAGMDVNLMLYRVSGGSWVNAGHPLKLHEYFAVGKPVVSADLAAVRPFADVLCIANGSGEWIAAIENALSGGVGSAEQRRAIARQNGWDARAALLESWLVEGVAAASPRPSGINEHRNRN